MYEEIIIYLIFKFLIGWVSGIYIALVPSFIREITAKDYAPYFGTATTISENAGAFIVYVFGFVFWEVANSVRANWAIMTSISIVPLILVLVAFQTGFIYESPMYLMRASADGKALAIFKEINHFVIKQLQSHQPKPKLHQ